MTGHRHAQDHHDMKVEDQVEEFLSKTESKTYPLLPMSVPADTARMLSIRILNQALLQRRLPVLLTV